MLLLTSHAAWGGVAIERNERMSTLILAIALMGHFWNTEETASLKCFDLDENQRVCIEEGEPPLAAAPADEFLIEKVNEVVRYDI